MNKPASANLIWEDNPDTAINASNLSKVIDYQSESKFILLSDSETDIQNWADKTEETEAAINLLSAEDYIGKIVSTLDGTFATTGYSEVDQTGNESFFWQALVAPNNKLLTIIPKTKIALEYYNINKDEIEYVSFDTEMKTNYFYVDHLIDEYNYSINSTYEIYLYYNIAYNGFAEIRIVKSGNTSNWKEGLVDASSPTGYKVIATRKIGGFETDYLGDIKQDTIWDLSGYNKEVIAESYKIYEGDKVRGLSAIDIVVDDANNNYTAGNNVEDALKEVKVLTDRVFEDTYINSRFGLEIKFSIFKKDNGSLVEIVNNANTFKLKMTKGFVDVAGQRIYFNSDTYFASLDNIVTINDFDTSTPSLGSGSGKLDEGIWRVYISPLGKILFKKDDVVRPKFLYSSILKGWYDTGSNSRCIAKFRVAISPTSTYYIEKQSITDTFENLVPTNTIYTYHGTMCPDGLLPCDGLWRDITGQDPNGWIAAPPVEDWFDDRWYEETPDMRDKTTKMINNFQMDQTLEFVFDDSNLNRIVTSGGSEGAGSEAGSTTHVHNHDHSHGPGTISIDISGTHTHYSTDVSYNETDVSPLVWIEQGDQNIQVAARDHDHEFNISGGVHYHGSEDFSGSVATLLSDGTNVNTEETSTWAPHKEILYCIKK